MSNRACSIGPANFLQGQQFHAGPDSQAVAIKCRHWQRSTSNESPTAYKTQAWIGSLIVQSKSVQASTVNQATFKGCCSTLNIDRGCQDPPSQQWAISAAALMSRGMPVHLGPWPATLKAISLPAPEALEVLSK